MAFIVKKKVHGKEYFYLNQNKRVEGKVKTKTLAYLGKDREEAEKKAKEIIEKMKMTAEEKKIEETEAVNEIEGKVKGEKQTGISVDEMATFCKRKGFVYPSGEIYGGLSGFWDYGPLGAEIKKNLKDFWWKFHVYKRQDMVGIDGAIITNPKVWEASGHVESFVDIAVVNKKTKEKFKVDKFEAEKYEKDPHFEVKGEFNPMFTTNVGPVVSDSIKSYLRPETAQLIFADFKSIADNARMKLPFGIAQIGKSFRNEIAPRDFLFRCREFEQMEIEYFINPSEECPYEIPEVKIRIYSSEMQESGKEPEEIKIREAFENGIIKNKWHAYWIATEYNFFVSLGANKKRFRIRQHVSAEKAHYSQDTWDLEYEFPFGWKELMGFADRGNFDLSQHEKFSKKDLTLFNEETREKILPNVVCEPSLGLDRAFLVFMFDSYFHDAKRNNIVLKMNPRLAPVKAAVFPIIKKEEYEKFAEEIVSELGEEWNVLYDRSGSIGRRYARNDEIGTPFCITVDEDSLKKNDVTVRVRDSGEQVRIKRDKLKDAIRQAINGKDILKLGKKVDTRKK